MAGPTTGTKFVAGLEVPVRTQGYGAFTLPVANGAAEEYVGGHGSRLGLYIIDEAVTLSTSGATTDTTATIPIGTVGVLTATRVNTTITTAVNYSLGISGATTRFQGTTTNVTAADTNCGSAWGSGTTPYTAATAIRIECNTTPGAGVVRVVAYCYYICPPTS